MRTRCADKGETAAFERVTGVIESFSPSSKITHLGNPGSGHLVKSLCGNFDTIVDHWEVVCGVWCGVVCGVWCDVVEMVVRGVVGDRWWVVVLVVGGGG